MKLMAVTLGGALATDLAIGMAAGLSAGFLLLAVLYTAVGYVVLQLYLKKGNGEAVCDSHVFFIPKYLSSTHWSSASRN